MQEVGLLLAVAAAFAFGFFLMTRLDRFFEENRQAQEREAEENSPSDKPGTEQHR